MFQLLGTVTEKLWPGMSQVPGLQGVKFRHQPYNRLAQRFPTLTPNGLDLLNKCVLRRHASIALCWFRFVVLTGASTRANNYVHPGCCATIPIDESLRTTP